MRTFLFVLFLAAGAGAQQTTTLGDRYNLVRVDVCTIEGHRYVVAWRDGEGARISGVSIIHAASCPCLAIKDSTKVILPEAPIKPAYKVKADSARTDSARKENHKKSIDFLRTHKKEKKQ